MNIVFMCGSLEPGRDGVGDYIRRLAAEIGGRGHSVSLLAINDKHITESLQGTQEADGVSMPTLRITADLPTKVRFAHARNWIDLLNADLISLQFVAFAFHPKGLSLSLNRNLEYLGRGRSWHIMFHELWVGMADNSNLKLVCWGLIQRQLIKSLVAKLQPIFVHTQTKLYQLQLADLDVKAAYLPLFSNIPVIRPTNASTAPNTRQVGNEISLVLFGGIHPSGLVQQFIAEAADIAKANNLHLILRIIGRGGTNQQHWVSICESVGLDIELYGEQSPESISTILSSSSIGISTTPIALIEKSGSVAAMREHGLPVICVREFWKARGIAGITPPKGIAEYKLGNLRELLHIEKSVTKNSVLSTVGNKFIADIHVSSEVKIKK